MLVSTPMNDPRDQKAIEMRRAGASTDAIAKALHRDKRAVRNVLRDAGFLSWEPRHMRATPRDSAETVASAARLLARIPPDTRTLGERLTGTPLPGRSALDKRNALAAQGTAKGI